MTQNQVKKRH